MMNNPKGSIEHEWSGLLLLGLVSTSALPLSPVSQTVSMPSQLVSLAKIDMYRHVLCFSVRHLSQLLLIFCATNIHQHQKFQQLACLMLDAWLCLCLCLMNSTIDNTNRPRRQFITALESLTKGGHVSMHGICIYLELNKCLTEWYRYSMNKNKNTSFIDAHLWLLICILLKF